MSRKRDHERAIFEAFLQIEPAFAGEALDNWDQPEDEKDFPDIIGKSVSGRCVGVELGEWLNEEEIEAAKRKERLEESILAVIGDQGTNPTEHFTFVWLHPKPTARITPADADGCRAQIFACTEECDRRFPNERFWTTGHQLSADELDPYPLLAKYLNAIRLWPNHGERHNYPNWITFPLRAGAFDRETMFKPLRQLVAEKVGHYAATRTGFDCLCLVVFYNLAWIYNSPAETPLHSFEDAVAELNRLFSSNRGPFDRVFLYVALIPGRVLRVF